MNNQMFLAWLFIATIQIILFSIFLFKKNKTVNEVVDIIPIVNYNNKAYWKENGVLVYAEYGDGPILKNHRKVDQDGFTHLSPVEIIYILDKLGE